MAGAEVREYGGVPDLGGPLLVLQERLTQVALLAQQPLHVPRVIMRIVGLMCAPELNTNK